MGKIVPLRSEETLSLMDEEDDWREPDIQPFVIGEIKDILEMFANVTAVVVSNDTDHQLRCIESDHDYGGFVAEPSKIIPARSTDVFISALKPGPYGNAGNVSYNVGDENVEAYIEWRNRLSPWLKNKSESRLTGSDRNEFGLTDDIPSRGSQLKAEYVLSVKGSGNGDGGNDGGGNDGGDIGDGGGEVLK